MYIYISDLIKIKQIEYIDFEINIYKMDRYRTILRKYNSFKQILLFYFK